MLKNLSDSNGKEINLIVIDDKSVLSRDFFDDLEFNRISRINEDKALAFLYGNPTQTFVDRFLVLYRTMNETLQSSMIAVRDTLRCLSISSPPFPTIRSSIGYWEDLEAQYRSECMQLQG